MGVWKPKVLSQSFAFWVEDNLPDLHPSAMNARSVGEIW